MWWDMKLAERIFRRTDYRLTSPYGSRVHPITKVPTFHYGTDYGTKLQKWAQYALEDGVVLACGFDSKGGNAIFAWVNYPRLNIKLLYYHLDKLFVKRGQKVNENTIIGNTGTTGFSTGIHLHLGTKVTSTNRYFDPESYDYQPPLVKPIQPITPTQPIQPTPIKVGDRVKVNPKATNYATGQRIPLWVKSKVYTIQTIRNDRALLKEIVSWVLLKDLIKVG